MASGGRKRVGFTPGTATPLSYSQSHTPEGDTSSGGHNTPLQRSDVSHEELAQSVHNLLSDLYTGEPVPDVQKPRPAIRKTARTPPPHVDNDVELQAFDDPKKKRSGLMAQRRAAKLSKSVGTYSAPGSRRGSNDMLMSKSPSKSPPVEHIETPQLQLPSQSGYDSAATDDEEEPEHMRQARQLYRQHTMRVQAPTIKPEDLYHSEVLASGQVTPTHEVEIEDEHVPRPTKFRTGVLGTLLRAPTANQHYNRSSRATGHGRNPSHGSLSISGDSTAANSPPETPPRSGYSTPGASTPRRSWYSRGNNQSVTSISKLVESSSMLATPAQRDSGYAMEEQYKKVRPGLGKRLNSNDSITTKLTSFGKKARRDEEYKIKIHLAGTLARQNYLRRLCKALMMYGAPTHRLEEYMNMSARVLEIEAQFLYMPGCMSEYLPGTTCVVRHY
jgi:hypothetical protein